MPDKNLKSGQERGSAFGGQTLLGCDLTFGHPVACINTCLEKRPSNLGNSIDRTSARMPLGGSVAALDQNFLTREPFQNLRSKSVLEKSETLKTSSFQRH